MDNATAPDLGTGPYGVELDASDGFYYLTHGGSRTGKSYPLGKTAYRTARKLNDDPANHLEPEANPTPRKVIKAIIAEPKPAKKPSWKRSTGTPDKREGAKIKPEPAPIPEAKAEEALDLSGTLFQGTREEWLNAFTAAARPVFKQRGHELPEKIRVSVGFMFRSPKAIGQCWAESASADGTREVFINPNQADSSRVADILTHELCHTLFGPDEKHGRNFKKAVTDLGLEGKATATVAGPGWREWAHPILQGLGPIPHAVLDPALSGVKKQSTRLLKCECEDCGFTFRATAKWVSDGEEGLRELRCPDAACGGVVEVKLPEGEGE